MANFGTTLAIGLLLALLTGIGLWLLERSQARKALTQAKEELQLQRIKPLQEEIGKIAQQTTTDRSDYQSALEAYNAKYRNTNANSKPPGGPGSQG